MRRTLLRRSDLAVRFSILPRLVESSCISESMDFCRSSSLRISPAIASASVSCRAFGEQIKSIARPRSTSGADYGRWRTSTWRSVRLRCKSALARKASGSLAFPTASSLSIFVLASFSCLSRILRWPTNSAYSFLSESRRIAACCTSVYSFNQPVRG